MQSRYQRAMVNSGQEKQNPEKMRRAPQRHQKSKRRGVAIILISLLIPVLFILLYLSSDQLRNDDINAAALHNDVFIGDENYESDNLQQLEDASPESSHIAEAPVEIIGTAYLTFDDGPDRGITPGILDILLEENVKATFFVLPNEGVDDIFRRIIDEGHEIGNHSFSHNYDLLYERNSGAFREDVLSARRFIYDNFGYTTTSFRFPGGSMSWPGVIRSRLDIINELGYRHYDWLVDSEDWRKGRDKDDIIREVLDQTKALGREHVIILMHDYRNSHETLEALPEVIKGLRELGYVFDVVSNYPTGLKSGFGSNS